VSVGLPQDKTAIDNKLGQVCLSLKSLMLNDIPNLSTYVGASGGSRDAYLTSLGYTAADITAIHSLTSTLSQFSQVFQGLLTIPSAVNVLGFVLPFTGPN
jgi:hypothetical protein